uniref:Putative basic tail protein n=1 Tax=Ixodes ricinus TaxID=34613 RepID=A0A0K8RB47_IXORI
MWFTGITLLLVSLAFLGSAADEECKNGTRPESQKDGEGCDYYCMNNSTKKWDHFFYGDDEKCFLISDGLDFQLQMAHLDFRGILVVSAQGRSISQASNVVIIVVAGVGMRAGEDHIQWERASREAQGREDCAVTSHPRN